MDIFSRLVAVDPWLGQPMAPPGMLELLIACGVFMVVNDNYIRYVYVYTYIYVRICVYYITLYYVILYYININIILYYIILHYIILYHIIYNINVLYTM